MITKKIRKKRVCGLIISKNTLALWRLKELKIMKKIAALLALFCFVIQGLQAQKKFQLGMLLSPSTGWIKSNGENISSDGNKLGFNFGLFGDFNFSENYSFSTGFSIINTGGEINVFDSDPAIKDRSIADIQLRYIQIPLTLKLKTNQIGYITYYGQFGLGMAINYHARADVKAIDANNQTIASSSNVDFKDEVNLFRASMLINVGAEYNLSGSTSIILGLGFDNGFTSIFDKKSSSFEGPNKESRDVKAINNLLLLNLGVIF